MVRTLCLAVLINAFGLIIHYNCQFTFAIQEISGNGAVIDKSKPNILLLLADDLGYGEVNQDPKWGFAFDGLKGAAGTPAPKKRKGAEFVLRTPNLARFAQQSVRSTMSYSPSPVCGPSRSCIFAERQVGAISFRGNPLEENQEFLEFTAFPKDLRDLRGYHTAYYGKWGLGRITGGPWNHGFDVFLGQLTHRDAHLVFPDHVTGFDAKVNNIPQTEAQLQNLTILYNANAGVKWSEQSCTLNPNSTCIYINDVIRDAALKFMNDSTHNPFFVVWAPTYPHAGQYYPGGPELSPVKRMSPDRVGTLGSSSKRGHASQIEQHFDGDVGMLLDMLQANPILDNNTFIVVTSDNGAQQDARDYNVNVFESTGGLRGYKRLVWEGGIKVPTMIRFRGTFSEGTVSRVPNALYDLGPTFREVAGLPQKYFNGAQNVPGGARSMYKVWKTGDEADAPVRDWLHFEFCLVSVDSQCQLATIDVREWRTGPVYKLVLMNRRTFVQLYDLRSDPGEKVSLNNKTVRKALWQLTKSIRTPVQLSAG